MRILFVNCESICRHASTRSGGAYIIIQADIEQAAFNAVGVEQTYLMCIVSVPEECQQRNCQICVDNKQGG